MLFADLLSLHLVTFLRVFFILVHVTFYSSTCMLELKFAIYYRAASLPSQASYAVLAESLTRTRLCSNTPAHQLTCSISNSAILHSKYISLLSDLCAHVHVKKNWHCIILQRAVWTASWDFKPVKKRWAGALVSAVLCENHCEKVTQIWTNLSEEERKTFWPSGDFLVWYFCDAF